MGAGKPFAISCCWFKIPNWLTTEVWLLPVQKSQGWRSRAGEVALSVRGSLDAEGPALSFKVLASGRRKGQGGGVCSATSAFLGALAGSFHLCTLATCV